MANTTDCPGTLNCPALPRVSLDQAVIDLLESIALQESALSHILCAESQKMKTAMGMEELDLCKLLEVNDSATNMVHAVANLEMMLRISWNSSPTTSIIPLPGRAVPPQAPRNKRMENACPCPAGPGGHFCAPAGRAGQRCIE